MKAVTAATPIELLEGAIECVAAAVSSCGAFRGLILTGSGARAEMTVVEHLGRAVWLSDLEFLVAIDKPSQLPRAREKLLQVCKRVNAELERQGQLVQVELTPAPVSYFQGLAPRIFSVELKECGRQIWGEEEYIDLIPPLDSKAIGREEAWRLLSNRLVERLSADLEWSDLTLASADYGLSKLALDILTSTAIFAGCYEPSYLRRYERRSDALIWLATAGMDRQQLDRYAELLEKAMRFKRTGGSAGIVSLPPQHWSQISDGPRGVEELEQDRAHLTRLALSVWGIQLRAMLRAGSAHSQNTLDLLRGVDGWHGRLKGWAVAVAKAPRAQRPAVLARVPRLAAVGAPRSLIYGAAWALLNSRLNSSDAGLLEWVERSLPFRGEGQKDEDQWRRLGADCVGFWRTVLRMTST